MLAVEDALTEIGTAAGAPRARAETVALADSLGRVLAEDVAMDHDVPPFRRATMDGFALAAARSAPRVALRVVGRVAAGESPRVAVRTGEAMRILTGAPLPEGTDCVVPFEAVDEAGDVVTLRAAVPAGDCVVAPAAYAVRGEAVLRKGVRVGPEHVAVLATAGLERVAVAVRPRVALLPTGSETVAVGRTPSGAQIRDSNGPMLVAQTRRAGGEPVDLGRAPDEEAALRAAIRRGLEHDLLVLSGGVSRGDLDLVPAALEAEGVRRRFHRWAVQPGGPLWFGTRGDTLVFGLPGNPAATFVGFELAVVPALRTRLGRPFAPRTALRARYAGSWGGPRTKTRYRPARLETDATGTLVARVPRWKGSGDPFAWTEAEALLALPAGRDAPEEGDAVVETIRLGEDA